MSSDEEIREVFEQDIAEKSKQVINNQSILPFLDGMDGMSIKELYWGVFDEDDRELLQKILDGEYSAD